MTFSEDYPFTDLLKKAGVNKAQLARRLGLTPNAISAWKEKPPKYAVAYLELLVANLNAERCQAALKRAAFALFQIKRMVDVTDEIRYFSIFECDAANKVLDGE